MAQKRMFALTITDSDAFLDMPLSSQALYFHLGMKADDDGFINNPKMIMRTISANPNDMDLLVAKKFILPFDNGVVVIKHWKLNNYIQSDRYNKTKYLELLDQLELDSNKAYKRKDDVYTLDTQIRLDKISIDKNKDIIYESENLENKKFVKPTLEEVEEYIKEKDYPVDSNKFFNFYESNGWKVGKNPMKSWKSAVATWLPDGWNKKDDIKKSKNDKSVYL